MTPASTTRGTAGDGRRARWRAHREGRREELVLAAVAAVEEHGRHASIDEIARSAGVSKPVLYRYFSDKDEVYSAVGRWGANRILEELTPHLTSDLPMRERVQAAAQTYFTLLEARPEVFLMLVQHRSLGTDDPLGDGKATVSAALERVTADRLEAMGLPTHRAAPWAHGVVGLGLSIGEWWLEQRDAGGSADRDDTALYFADFVWGAIVGMSRSGEHDRVPPPT